MKSKIMIEVSVCLPEGFYEYVCHICKGTIIIGEKYFSFNADICQYTSESISYCPLCASKIYKKVEA